MRFFRLLLKDLLSLFKDDKEELHLESFSFPDEIPTIMKIAREYFDNGKLEYPVNPYALLFAIREAEKGRKGFEFGIIIAKNTDLETQCKYACQTIAVSYTHLAYIALGFSICSSIKKYFSNFRILIQ